LKKDIETKLTEQRDRRVREVPEFIYDFVETIKHNRSLNTQIEIIKDVGKFLEFLMQLEGFEAKKNIIDFTPQDMGNINERQINDFLSYLTNYKKTIIKKDGSLSTQKFSNTKVGLARKLSSIRTIYRYLINRKILKVDPTINVTVSTPKFIGVGSKLNDEQLRAYLDTIQYDINVTEADMKYHDKIKFRDYNISLLLAYVGLRVSELVQLDIPDVNLDRNEPTIKVIRKRDKTQVLPLPCVVVKYLAEYIEQRKIIEGVDAKYKDALFLSLQKKRINDRTVRHLTGKYRKRGEINIKVTPHSFRRTFGTKFYNVHKDIEMTRDILGHETTETTRRYAELDKERETQAMSDFAYNGDVEVAASEEIGLDITQLRKLAKQFNTTVDEIISTLSKDNEK
jgi:site-specific recombinase XerD